MAKENEIQEGLSSSSLTDTPDAKTRTYVDEALKSSSQGLRGDFILIFGVFAALLVFLGIEVQVFSKAPRFSLLVGFSCFLLGSILAFLLGIQNILKERVSFKDYAQNPLVSFIALCFIAAIICFYWAAFHKPRPNTITISHETHTAHTNHDNMVIKSQ